MTYTLDQLTAMMTADVKQRKLNTKMGHKCYRQPHPQQRVLSVPTEQFIRESQPPTKQWHIPNKW